MSYEATPRSSVDRDQESWTALLPAVLPRRSSGRLGARSSAAVAVGVVARTRSLGGPSLPSASRARTEKAYSVDGSSLVMSAMCSEPGTSFTFVVPRYTS
jgi:hypothetical protein